jgi:nitrite reductase/ring-hydroxylating ferredoxin subunit
MPGDRIILVAGDRRLGGKEGMIETTRTLKEPYSAYRRDRTGGPDEELTRVGPGTPCGEYLRRFWQPVLHSEHVAERPVAFRILGEDLVAFRDGDGRLGVLERACCHRGTSLEFGKVEARGLRCCYHGWLFDADGAILETPGEPPESRIKDKTYQGAYPTLEYKGLVFVYMGPPEEKPAFPLYDAFEREDAYYVRRYWHSPCNWLQVRENEMDPIHLTFLHTRVFGTQFTECYGDIPTLEFEETETGMCYVTVRRWKDKLYLRTAEMMMPNISRVAGIEDAEEEVVFDRRGSALAWVVPVDDTNTLVIGFSDIDKTMTVEGSNAYRDRMERRRGYTVGVGDVGQTGDRSYEERQDAPGDWDAWVSQGPITRHGAEHLGVTDRGVVLYRRLLREGIRATARGEDPKNLLRAAPAEPILTITQNTVLSVPPGRDEAEERALRLAFGRELVRQTRMGELPKDTLGVSLRRPALDLAAE